MKLPEKELIQIFKKLIKGEDKSWVLFSNSTCVILTKPEEDLKKQAVSLMKEYGPVHVGGSAGDFRVLHLKDNEGWVVVGHHPDILVYVSPKQVEKSTNDLVMGMYGRSKRDLDAKELQIIHIEDNRKK